MIVGGWEYVVGAYTLTWCVLLGYACSLIMRHRRLKHREGRMS